MRKAVQELRKLHNLVIHRHQEIKDDQEWAKLARRETKAVAKMVLREDERICVKGCGF